MEKIFTDKAPAPGGHYSQAVVHDGVVYVSAQLPISYFTGEKINGSVEEQTHTVLENLNNILEKAGSNKNKVMKTTIYITDLSNWAKVNSVYADFFGKHKPARTVVPVKVLNFGFLVEIDAIASI
jgi:reactive intermediate/imine deaminase